MPAEHNPFWLNNVRLQSSGSATRAVFVSGGTVASVEERPRTRDPVVDAGSRLLLPGLWDAHVHLDQWASVRRRVDVSRAASAAEAADLMAAAAAGRPGSGGTLVGYGFRDGLWPDQPDADLLAARCPDIPIALVSKDLHAAWLNRPALQLAGFGAHPTGLLREADSWTAMDVLNDPGAEEMDRWVLEAMGAAASRGVVGIIDFEHGDPLEVWPRRAAWGELPTRIVAAVYPRYLDAVIRAGLSSGSLVEETAGLARIGALKLFLDGSLNTRTALCYSPYPGGGGHGQARTELSEAVSLMERAASHGLLTALHAIGDRANSLALDAFEKVGCEGRIEHAQLVDWADLPRFGRPGLVLGVQPSHAVDDRDVADLYWQDSTERSYAYASLLGAGATLEFGSDAPVSTLDPWQGIAAAVFRTEGRRPPWHPEQRLSVVDALAASSRGLREVAVGMAADLVLIGSDPEDLDQAGLRDMPVAGTIVGGRFTYRDL